MNVSKFYRESRCAKAVQLDGMVSGPVQRSVIMSKESRTACYMLCAGEGKETILNRIRKELSLAYQGLPKTCGWQVKEWVSMDVLKIERFIDYLTSEHLKPLACDKLVEQRIGVAMPDGSENLSCLVHLIVQAESGAVRAFFIHPGKSSRSVKGRNHSTKAESDLSSIVAKLALEEDYPGIEIGVVYLSNDKDSATDLTDFLVNDTAKSNLHRLFYDEYRSKDGVLNKEALLELAKEVVSSQTAQDCETCRQRMMCQTPLLYQESSKTFNSVEERISEKTDEKSRGYVLPTYTEEQSQVVNHTDGSMVVCAGPGSGKTATLTGRIYHLLVEEKIPSEWLLVISFTKKAVEELKERCLGFLDESKLPKICTFHSFCYTILKENKHLFRNGKVKVLGERDKIEIIRNLVSVFPRMRGFNYDVDEGRYGLLKTILNRITYLEENGVEAFCNKYDCDEKFFEFCEQYKLAVRDGGYISFDQQIEYCNLLFAKHPEILQIYQDIFKYIMVDEFQDVNDEQVKLLYSIAGKHQNLVVVGDDDQTIYGFRGSKSEFMLGFDKDYPDSEKVVFTKNFRSSKAIVDASKMLINNNKHRIQKDVQSCKGDFGKKEMPPVIIPSMQPEVIDGLIGSLIEEGYQYGDMAIISAQNAPLRALHKALKAPTVLSKAYLTEDAFFILLYSAGCLYLNQNDDKAAYQYFRLYDDMFYVVKQGNESLLSAVLRECGLENVNDAQGGVPSNVPFARAVSDLFNYFCIFEQNDSLPGMVDILLLLTHWNESDSGDVIKETILNNGFETLSQMVSYMSDIVMYEEEGLRVELKKEDKVTLITSHESKGKEFKVVIYRNDTLTGDNMEEVRRVVYVTITRPMERVYILQGKDTKFDISKEIDHVLLEV